MDTPSDLITSREKFFGATDAGFQNYKKLYDPDATWEDYLEALEYAENAFFELERSHER